MTAMNKIIFGAGAVLALSLPVAAHAGVAEDVASSLGATAIPTGIDMPFSHETIAWEGSEIGDDGLLHVRGLTISENGATTTAALAALSPGYIRMTEVSIQGNAADERHSGVTIAELSIEGGEALDLLIVQQEQRACAPGTDDLAGVMANTLRASGIEITAPPMPEETGLAASALETIKVAEVVTALRVDAAMSCLDIPSLDIARISSVSADGSTGKIDALSMTSDMFPAEDINGFWAASLQGATFADPVGRQVLAIEQVSVHGEIGESLLELARAQQDMPALEGTSLNEAFVAALAMGRADFRFDLLGLDIPAGIFTPQVSERFGIAPDQAFSGDMRLVVSAPGGGQLLISEAVDIEGLARTDLKLHVGIGEQSSAGGLASIMRDDPRISLASRFSLIGAEFSHEDKGLSAIVEASTGMEVSALVLMAEYAAVKIPAGIRTPIFAWLSEALETSGRATLAPEGPVGFIEIGMTAAMKPEQLPELLGLSLD